MDVITYRNYEIEAISFNEFSVIDCETFYEWARPARGNSHTIRCNRCNHVFEDTLNRLCNCYSNIITCEECGNSSYMHIENVGADASFLIDKEYAIQYYGFLAAISAYNDGKIYYILKDTGIMLWPITRYEIRPEYYGSDARQKTSLPIKPLYLPDSITAWKCPEWLNHEFVYSVIERDTGKNPYIDEVKSAEIMWKDIISDAFNNAFFVDEEIYMKIKDRLPDTSQMIDPLIMGKIARLYYTEQSSGLNIKKQQKDGQTDIFTKYYLHNIPINDLKNISGIRDVSGVYILRDENGIYYVGQGKNCIKRCLQHFQETPIDDINKA